MKVLIPIDETKFHFGELTKHTNPGLIRVGKKPIISYIIESYPKDTEFILALDYKKDHIKDFLTLVYPKQSFKIISLSEIDSFSKEPFLYHPTNLIRDIKALHKARKNTYDKFDNLDKVDESLFFFEDFAIKFFADGRKIKSRVQRGKMLGNLVPKTLQVKNNFYKYAYIKGDTYSDVATPHNFSQFLHWAKVKLWKPKKHLSEKEFNSVCFDFYQTKTKERIAKFLDSHNISDSEMIINGEKIPSIETLLSQIDFGHISSGIQTQFHGDLILENILLDKKEYTLLDWRQDFGGVLHAGDMYYDLAKLYHNLVVNHDIISKDRFVIDVKKNRVICSIERKPHLVVCEKTFEEFVISQKLDLRKIKILRAIIWLNMSPLHHHPFSLFLYYFGKYNLWKAVNEK